jgi:DNA-binding NarL/FixJ family response regulator
MRAILVGSPTSRERLRARLGGTRLEVVGEYPTIALARRSGIDADAIVLAADVARDADERDGAAAEALTPREIEVLELLAEGLSNKAIATELGVSDQTVKFHVASISGKLGAANRTDAVRLAVRRGLIAL